MAMAAMGRGVWERDTPPLPRGRLRRPGTPPGSLRGERGPFSGGHPWVCCSHRGDVAPSSGPDPVSSVGSVCLWGR